jgi:hypothetical protein
MKNQNVVGVDRFRGRRAPTYQGAPQRSKWVEAYFLLPQVWRRPTNRLFRVKAMTNPQGFVRLFLTPAPKTKA